MLPDGGLLLWVWVAGGLLTLAGALTYAELGVMFPRAGGLYHYLKEAYGPLCGFLYGWIAFLVIMSGGLATIAVGFGKYLASFFPSLAETVFAVPGLPGWEISGIQLAAVGSILLLTAVNHIGLEEGAWVQNALTVLKVGSILVFGVLACSRAPSAPRQQPAPAPSRQDTARTAGGRGQAPAVAPKPYNQVITAGAVTDSGVFIVHRIGEKLYYEIPRAMLGRQFRMVVDRRGTIRGVDVSGVTFAIVAEIPGNVLKGNWKIAVYVSDQATPVQKQAVLDAWTGKLGGPLADLAQLVGEVSHLRDLQVVGQRGLPPEPRVAGLPPRALQARDRLLGGPQVLLELGECFQRIEQYKLALSHYEQAIDAEAGAWRNRVPAVTDVQRRREQVGPGRVEPEIDLQQRGIVGQAGGIRQRGVELQRGREPDRTGADHGDLRPVGYHIEAHDTHVVQIVGGECAHRARLNRGALKCACLIFEQRFGRRDWQPIGSSPADLSAGKRCWPRKSCGLNDRCGSAQGRHRPWVSAGNRCEM